MKSFKAFNELFNESASSLEAKLRALEALHRQSRTPPSTNANPKSGKSAAQDWASQQLSSAFLGKTLINVFINDVASISSKGKTASKGGRPTDRSGEPEVPWQPIATGAYAGWSPVQVGAERHIGQTISTYRIIGLKKTPNTLKFDEFMRVLCAWAIIHHGISNKNPQGIKNDLFRSIAHGNYGFNAAQLISARVFGWTGSDSTADLAAIEKAHKEMSGKFASSPKPLYRLLEKTANFATWWPLLYAMNNFAEQYIRWIMGENGANKLLYEMQNVNRGTLDKIWSQWKKQHNIGENWDGVVRSNDMEDLHEVVASMPRAKAGNLTFQSFKEGSVTGWLIVQHDNTEVGFLEMPAKRNSKTAFSPVKLFIWSAPVRGASGGSGTEGQPRHVLSLYPMSVSGDLPAVPTGGSTGVPRTLYDKASGIPARVAAWLGQNKSVWSHRVKA